MGKAVKPAPRKMGGGDVRALSRNDRPDFALSRRNAPHCNDMSFNACGRGSNPHSMTVLQSFASLRLSNANLESPDPKHALPTPRLPNGNAPGAWPS